MDISKEPTSKKHDWVWVILVGLILLLAVTGLDLFVGHKAKQASQKYVGGEKKELSIELKNKIAEAKVRLKDKVKKGINELGYDDYMNTRDEVLGLANQVSAEQGNFVINGSPTDLNAILNSL